MSAHKKPCGVALLIAIAAALIGGELLSGAQLARGSIARPGLVETAGSQTSTSARIQGTVAYRWALTEGEDADGFLKQTESGTFNVSLRRFNPKFDDYWVDDGTTSYSASGTYDGESTDPYNNCHESNRAAWAHSGHGQADFHYSDDRKHGTLNLWIPEGFPLHHEWDYSGCDNPEGNTSNPYTDTNFVPDSPDPWQTDCRHRGRVTLNHGVRTTEFNCSADVTDQAGNRLVISMRGSLTESIKSELEITRLHLNDIDNHKLKFLSVSNDYGTNQGPIFNRKTRIHGTITLKGEKTDKLKTLELEVLENGSPVATAKLAPAARRALIGKPFGADGELSVTASQLLFELPEAEASNVDQAHDGWLELQAKATSERGASANKTYRSVTKLVRYLGKNRYGPRDLKLGGDDWVTPSVAEVLTHFAGGHCFGDMSNMNGGLFLPHQTHQGGLDADVKFDSPTGCAANGSFSNASAADAQRILDDLNDPTFGSRIGNVYVTFRYANNDPFWATIKSAVLADGRQACRVIESKQNHDTHFHWRIDHTDARPGKCLGDPGVPSP